MPPTNPAYIARKLAQYTARGYLPEWIVPHLTTEQLHIAIAAQTRHTIQLHTNTVSTTPTPSPVQQATPVPSRRSSPTSTTQSSSTIPEHVINQLKELHTALNKKFECSICMEDIEPSHIKITGCGHAYCEGCLSQLKAAARLERQWTCAVCRVKHSH